MLPAIVKNLAREEKGLAMVLVAASLTVILGFTALVVDVGALYLTRNRLINACDAAALAAARELPDGDPEQVAEYYLEENGVDPETEAVISVSADSRRVTVQATREVKYGFARVLGFSSSDVDSGAAAEYGAVNGADGIVPFAVPDQELEFNKQYVLKKGAGGGEEDGSQIHGNFGALALGGTGADNYEDNLKYGYDGSIDVGDIVNIGEEIETETGNMSGPTYDGVTHRLNQCANGCTSQDYDPGCPKVVIVPVFDPDTLDQGRDEVTIVGFAAFFLEGVAGHGNESEVTGTFLEMSPAPGINHTIDPGAPDYGFHAAKLVE